MYKKPCRGRAVILLFYSSHVTVNIKFHDDVNASINSFWAFLFHHSNALKVILIHSNTAFPHSGSITLAILFKMRNNDFVKEGGRGSYPFYGQGLCLIQYFTNGRSQDSLPGGAHTMSKEGIKQICHVVFYLM